MQQNHRDRLANNSCSYYCKVCKTMKDYTFLVLIICGGNHYDNFDNLYVKTAYDELCSYGNVFQVGNFSTFSLLGCDSLVTSLSHLASSAVYTY